MLIRKEDRQCGVMSKDVFITKTSSVPILAKSVLIPKDDVMKSALRVKTT